MLIKELLKTVTQFEALEVKDELGQEGARNMRKFMYKFRTKVWLRWDIDSEATL